MSDLTPSFVAYCPECGGLVGVSVADIQSPHIAYALRDRRQWERAGLRVETKTVEDVRAHQGKLGHVETCVKGQKARKRAQRQKYLAL